LVNNSFYFIFFEKESVCNFLPRDLYANVTSFENISIKHLLPIDFSSSNEIMKIPLVDNSYLIEHSK
jgi:hypothetical protein